MANINKELKDIKQAVYGREVRGSIHDGIKKINEEIEGATELTKDTELRQSSLEEQFDEQIKNQTIDDPSSAELVAARTNTKDDETYPTIGRRMDDEYSKVTQQLAQKANQIDIDVLNVDYGEIILPSDFPHEPPFKIEKIDDGRIEHGFNIEKYKSGAGVVYLDYTIHKTDEDGLTPETPTKHLAKAFEIAEGLSEETIIIYIMNKYYPRNYIIGLAGNYTLTKNIIFSPYKRERSYIGNFEDPTLLSWTKDGNAYKTTRSAALYALDSAYNDKNGEPLKYKKVNNPQEVNEEQGTYCIDGDDMWVRRYGDKKPDDDLMVLLNMAIHPSFIISDKKLIFDRVSWFFSRDKNRGDTEGLKVTGNVNSELILYQSSFAYADLNGVTTHKVGTVINVESKAYDNGTDGFNYHASKTDNPYEFVYEYYIEAYDNGGNGLGNNNGSTAHGGLSILRIGSLCYRCEGPVIADVNGCYSILIDCVSHTSTREHYTRLKSGFYFNDSQALKDGKVILVNCGGGGKDTHSLGSDGIIKLQIKGTFKGRNIWREAEETMEFI